VPVLSTKPSFKKHVQAVRRFNRFYTTQIGVLREAYSSPFSLTEVRILFELAHREHPSATELGRDLGLDAGYLSRIFAQFERKRLISRSDSKADRRQQLVSLTSKGHRVFTELNAKTDSEIGIMLRRTPAPDRERLVRSMDAIESVLAPAPETKAPYVLRPHRPGDMGWIVHRHGVLYSQEYGWDERFEALVAEIVGKFIPNFDPKRERCWIAEREGEIVGSVFLVKKTKTVAKLRLLYVEPKARGLGIGVRLVDECIRFASQAGYKKITLWTQSNLHAARHIYRKSGFKRVESKPQSLFGFKLVSETWELAL
jgi:DNA-binding MarR family transcriptional regulator/N-acetylglutamate synthase-like GNAT family acetyltransferase